MCGYVYAYGSVGIHRVQKRTLDPRKLVLQEVLSHPTKVLGTELVFIEGTVSLFSTEPSLHP